MLIVLETSLWRMGPDAAPALLHDKPARAAAEGVSLHAVAFADATVSIFQADGKEASATVDDPAQCLLVLSEDPPVMLIGTEGAHLYRLQGPYLERVIAFDQLDCRRTWYTPWGGPPSVRSLAVSADGWVYADIHVGSIMRSPDGGVSWQGVGTSLDEDVHQVAVCPADPRRVYANTASAVFISPDHGDSWTHVGGGELRERYGRAIAVCPTDPDFILASVSDGPHDGDLHAQLYRSHDGGQSWQQVVEGFPTSLPQNINTHHLAFDEHNVPWAVAGSDLYRGSADAARWERVWTAPQPIGMISAKGARP